MAFSAEISESLPTLRTLEIVDYPKDEESESKGRDDEAGKFDDKPDNRVHCLMTRSSSQRENLSGCSHAISPPGLYNFNCLLY